MSKKKQIIIVITVCIIIIVITIASISYFKKNKNSNETNDISDVNFTGTKPVIDMDDTKNVEIDNNKKINNSEVLNTNHNTYNYDNRDEIYQDFTISDISLEGDSETSLATFKAKITNVGSSDINRLYCMLYFYDNDDNVLYSFEYVEDEFKINETRDINFFAQTDFSNAKDFKLACKNLE